MFILIILFNFNNLRYLNKNDGFLYKPIIFPFKNIYVLLDKSSGVESSINNKVISFKQSIILSSKIFVDTFDIILKWLIIPTLPPSGESIGQTNPHCELCNFLGPNDLDPAGNGNDNLLIWDNVPNVVSLFKSWTIPCLPEIFVPNRAPNDLDIYSIIEISKILFLLFSLINSDILSSSKEISVFLARYS